MLSAAVGCSWLWVSFLSLVSAMVLSCVVASPAEPIQFDRGVEVASSGARTSLCGSVGCFLMCFATLLLSACPLQMTMSSCSVHPLLLCKDPFYPT